MVLGYLNPAALAGGSLRVDAALSRRAVEAHVARPLGLAVEEAAHGIRQVANVNMARAIRAVSAARTRATSRSWPSAAAARSMPSTSPGCSG